MVDRDVSARLDRPAEEKRFTTEERTLHQAVPGVPDITSRYDRADTVPEVAAGLNAWAAHVEGLLTAKTPADVVPIRSVRQRKRG